MLYCVHRGPINTAYHFDSLIMTKKFFPRSRFFFEKNKQTLVLVSTQKQKLNSKSYEYAVFLDWFFRMDSAQIKDIFLANLTPSSMPNIWPSREVNRLPLNERCVRDLSPWNVVLVTLAIWLKSMVRCVSLDCLAKHLSGSSAIWLLEKSTNSSWP